MTPKRPERSCILTVNGGSSSLKFARFNAPVISTDWARGRVRVIRTDEEAMIARAAARFVPE